MARSKWWLIPFCGTSFSEGEDGAPLSQEVLPDPALLDNFCPASNHSGKIDDRLILSFRDPWIKQIIWTLFSLGSGQCIAQRWDWLHLLITFGTTLGHGCQTCVTLMSRDVS